MQVEESTHSFGEGREMCFMQKSSKTKEKVPFSLKLERPTGWSFEVWVHNQLRSRGSHQAPKPLAFQIVHLEWSDCNETCRKGKVGPPESVQTIFSQHTQHICKIFNFLGFLILWKFGSVSPHKMELQASQAGLFSNFESTWKIRKEPMAWLAWIWSGGDPVDLL